MVGMLNIIYWVKLMVWLNLFFRYLILIRLVGVFIGVVMLLIDVV